MPHPSIGAPSRPALVQATAAGIPTITSRRVPWRHHHRHALVLLLAAAIAACSSAPPRPSPQAANGVLFRAIGLVGTPYRYGGNSPASGFDCSGLVDYVFRSVAGIALPRTSHDIAEVDAPKLRRRYLASGDLVFFHGGGRRVSHVGIYVGNGRFVHAPNRGGTVRLDRLNNPYWSKHFLYGKRVLR